MSSDWLELRDVSVSAGGKSILSQISLRLNAGESVAVVGPNGAGKTTLLRALAGVQKAAAGAAYLNGNDIRTLGRRVLAQKVALLAQAAPATFPMTAHEVIRLGRTPYLRFGGGLQRHDEEKVLSAAQMVGVEPLLHRRVNTLSGGEAQRVRIAMALAQEPRFLMLDEPLLNLDIAQQVRIINVMRTIRQELGIGVCAVLHDLALVRAVFRRVIVVDGGQMVADGAPAATLTDALMSRIFCLDPADWLQSGALV
jgi:iron complex transport system ATP-binding protein